MNRTETLNQFFKIVDNYLETLQDRKVVDYVPPEELKQIMDIPVKKEGEPEKLLENVEKYLKYCVHTGNTQFFNQLFAGFSLPAFLGEITAAMTSSSLYTYEVAPVATLMEMELVDKMLGLIGFPNGEGIFLTGGSNANMVAMFSARNRLYPDVRENGMTGKQPLCAFTSEESHYSLPTAGNLLGIGMNNVILVKSDDNGRMIPEELEKEIKASIDRGLRPFFVCGTAATTMTGSFDPFNDIADIAEKYDMWFHVDASFGGSLLLSEDRHDLFKGVTRADSFCWNPHKIMTIPMTCSSFFVKEKGRLYENLQGINTDYLFHTDDSYKYDLGKRSLQCGRRIDILKLWFAWKYFGDDGYKKRMDNIWNVAKYCEQRVIESDKLELLVPRQSITVCFRMIPPEGVDNDEFNLKVRDNLRLKGKTLVNYGYVNGQMAIRPVISNNEIANADIDKFMDSLLGEIKIQEELLK